MPDNHFENKVKQTLDELHFIPSKAVWHKVEEQIKKEDDRMRFLLWLPLLCLFLGGTVWFLLPEKSGSVPVDQSTHAAFSDKDKSRPISDNSPADHRDSESNSVAEKTQAGINEGGYADKRTGENAQIKKTARITEPTEKGNGAGVFANRKSGNRSGETSNVLSGRNTNESGENTNKKDGGFSAGSGNRIDRSGNGPAGGAYQPDHPNSQTIPQPSSPPLSADDENQKTAVAKEDHPSGKNLTTVADSLGQGKPASVKTKLADSLRESVVKKIKTPKQGKIQWGVYGSGGASSFFLQSPRILLVNAAPSPGSPPGGGYPSHQGSFSFQLGLILQKPLNKTTNITAGLGFTRASVRIKRGQLVNQSMAFYSANALPQTVNNYYAAAPPHTSKYNYTQHYDLVEIPMGIEKKLGSRSRFSVNAGLSVAWLLSTNALQYDQQTGNYYRDNSYFNRMQLNVSGGVQYSLLQTGKFVLNLGPQVQYGLTGLLNKKSPYKEHLFLGGLRLVLTSNRK
jgi:hypothetical protein